MNRIIKFRAYSGYSKKVHSDVCLNRLFGQDYVQIVDANEEVITLIGEEGEPMTFDSVMQYTGLKDKNGKEIYEGDIVEYYEEYMDGSISDYSQIEVVEYYDCGFSPMSGELFTGKNIEIIGNIHLNPELLEAK